MLLSDIFSAQETRQKLKTLYGSDYISEKARFEQLLDGFRSAFGAEPCALFSAPGRTEICGNHTDHQHGRVIAASVDLDIIAAARPTASPLIRILSEGFEMDCIDLSCLDPLPEESAHSASIIRGVASRFHQLGYRIGGFDAYTTSRVPKGSGLSSSAAFEVLVGTILSHLFNAGKVSDIEIAQIGQYAENLFFGKPSGLMDQTASSVGGAVFIDFADVRKPAIEKLRLDPVEHGYALCVINTGADHADLTGEYAAMPNEMRAVAACLGKEVLREVDESTFLANLDRIRKKCGDRAALRAFHYFEEDKRVVSLADALKKDDFESFLAIVRDSGRSSFMYLQNVFPTGAVFHQEVAFALMLCDSLLNRQGAFRVHGGGLAGTIQAFVPLTILDRFKSTIETVLGAGTCYNLRIRPAGGEKIAEW